MQQQSRMSGNPFADSNEECCGACRSGGDLICCEGCPAAFHPECAGYYADDEVPKGDWLCWFCCKEQGKRYQHPKTQFQHPGGRVPILLATDDSAEVFCRVKLLNESDRYMECICVDIESEPEIVPKTSSRLWHGTANKAAWTIDSDNVHWRPNCRLFKVDKAAIGRRQGGQQQQQQQGAPTSNNDVNGTHGHGSAHPHTSQQDHQQAAAAAGASKQRPPPAPTRLSVPPSPLQAGVESVGVLSPDSAGAPSPGGVAYNAAVEKALEVAAKRGVQRIPVGEVGAGLPVVQGGAGKDLFDGALHHFWKGYSRVSREKVPSHITIGGTPVDTWVFWREVWAWGGPETVQKNKLWATIGHCFNPPPGATSLSSRMSQFYNTMLAPFDKAVDAGNLKLERPAANRVPTDRWLQIRAAPAQAPGPKRRNSQGNLQAAPAPPSAAPSPTNSSGGTEAISGSTAAAAAAAAAPDDPAPAGGRSGSGKQRQRQRQRKPRAKRRRADQWSDNDEDDVILADDVESTDESDDGRQDSSEDEAPQRQRQRQQQQHKGLREGGGNAGGNGSGSSKPSKRLRVNMSKVKEELVADGLDSAGGYEYLRQPTDFVVLGKVTLTPAAQAIQVGDVVDFRQACSSGVCVTGWRSGTVLAIAPGSEWEGGRRLFIKPRHAIHHHHHQQQQGSASSLPPESPAAAALAAVAAAGGPIGGAAAESAAQKLLTPSGHLRHELAGLLPARSGSVKLGSAGDAGGTPPPPAAAAAAAAAGGGSSQQQQQRAGSDGADTSDQPVWVPMVWRGDCWQPFLAPPVLVRPHYAPNTALVVGAGGSRSAGGDRSAESPFASLQQQQQGHGQQQQELRVGGYVEALKEGCWCPAQVLEVLQNGGGIDGGTGACVVLRSMAPPEADGSVWRCSGTHPMRPMHPRYTSGCGVVQCAGPEELVTVAAMKKSMAPYLYSEGVHAFACLDHMHAAARAAAQG